MYECMLHMHSTVAIYCHQLIACHQISPVQVEELI